MGSFGRMRLGRLALSAIVLAGAGAGALAVIPDMIGREGTQPLARVQLPNFTRIDLPAPVSDDGDGEDATVDLTVDQATEQAAVAAEGASIAPSEGAPAEPRGRVASVGPDKNGLLPLSFDVMRPGAGSERVGADAIVVRKPVRINDREVGSLPIHIDGNSRLLVDPKELKSVLARSGIARDVGGGAGLLTFVQLRENGIDLRYDPSSDSLLITTG